MDSQGPILNGNFNQTQWCVADTRHDRVVAIYVATGANREDGSEKTATNVKNRLFLTAPQNGGRLSSSSCSDTDIRFLIYDVIFIQRTALRMHGYSRI